jgi:3-deoxy-D-manno-octulosonic-acid transferase
MLWLYRFLFLPLALLAAPYYGWRMRRRGGYGPHFGQRFGAVPRLPAKRSGVRRIWVQAVSVGELLALAPLLEDWREQPGVEVYLSTTTSTAYTLAESRYLACGLVLGLGYFPLDFWACSRRAWAAISPDLAVLTEGERWPEHLHQAMRRNVPVVAVNARLSDRSYRRMRRFGPLARLLTRGFTHVLAASAGDAERFAAFGVAPCRIQVMGNLKLDVKVPSLSIEEQELMRAQLGLGNAKILLGASTWPGEEMALIEAWQRLRTTAKSPWKLLLVPRHAERREELRTLLTATALPYHFRSQGDATVEVDITIADTTGELSRLLTLAELVFIGKTLPPHKEGQTPVEAAAHGKAMLVGPGTANFRAILRELSEANAIQSINDKEDLVRQVLALSSSLDRRAALGVAAARWHSRNRGATARTAAALGRILNPEPQTVGIKD